MSALGPSFNAQLQVDYTNSIAGQSSTGKSGGVSAAGASSGSGAAPAARAADGSAAAAAAAASTTAGTAQTQLGAFAAVLEVADKRGRDINTDAASGTGAVGGSAATAGPWVPTAAQRPWPQCQPAASGDQRLRMAGLKKIDAGINSPEFSQAIADRVSYMAGNNLNGATLQVTPPQLGPIEMRVSVENGHAQVWLSSHSPATLDALQASTPKLREMLSSQGFAQVSVDVSQRSFQDRSAYPQNSPWTPAPNHDAAPALNAASASASPRAALGVLDAYA